MKPETPLFHEFAPAKVNLTLEITSRRADGFHEMQSLVYFTHPAHSKSSSYSDHPVHFAEAASRVDFAATSVGASPLSASPLSADRLTLELAESFSSAAVAPAAVAPPPNSAFKNSPLTSTDAGSGLAALPLLSISGPFAPELANTESDNLVIRAVLALRDALLSPQGSALLPPQGDALPVPQSLDLAALFGQMCFKLEKNLPIASGIGGGSADAAAALRAVARLIGLPAHDARLAHVAQSLGSDVLACLFSQACLMHGVGEKMAELPAMPPLFLLLVNPRLPMPTPPVYAAYRQQNPQGPFSPPRALPSKTDDVLSYIMAGRNDLYPAAARLCPAIDEVLKALWELPGCFLARMSGSGASCFALFDSAAEKQAAAIKLREQAPNWWIV